MNVRAVASGQNKAPDAEKLAAAAVALAVLREKSAVIYYQGVREALEDLAKAYGIKVCEEEVTNYCVYSDEFASIEEKLYEYVARYRIIPAAEDSDADVLVIAPDSAFKDYVTEIVDPDLFDAAYIYSKCGEECKQLIENYLTLKFSKCLEEWSSAREALRRSEDAGFEIYVTHEYINSEYEGYIEYTVKAPTGEEFKIHKNIDYCNYCIHNGASIGIQKCVSYTWEKDERWAKQEELQ
jgi:hypothetical protein